MAHTPSPQCLGLVGGLGPAATVHYYQEIAQRLNARGIAPRLVISHADSERVLEYVQRDELDALTDYLNDHLRWMAAAGATIAAIPAVTPHICAPALAKIAPLPLVDIVDATRAALHRRGLKRVSLMGTRFAMESRFFGRIDGVEIVLPPPADVAFIHETYMGIVSSARTAPAAVDRLRHIARTMIDRDGVEAIVIAGTDLSLAFDEESAGFPALDCARVHLDALVEAMLRST